MNLLTVEGITKTFGDKKIFDGRTFGIDTGDYAPSYRCRGGNS